MKSLAFALLAVLLGLSACGGDDDVAADAAPAPDQAPPIDAPPGLPPLLVTGTFVVENTMNGTSGNGLRVNCELTVTRDGAPVTNAVITINPAPPAFQVTLVGEALNPNHYVGFYQGYFETARVTVVVDGEQEIPETLLRGPQLFQIEQPTLDAIVPPMTDLAVSWGLPGGAVTSADVATESGYLSAGEMDDGSSTIPGASVTAMDDQAIVTRWRDNPIAAGAAGSGLGFAVRSYQPFHAN